MQIRSVHIFVLGLMLFFPFSQILAKTIAEGIDYATVTHNDPWDMSNREDIFSLDWVHNLATFSFENGILTATPKDNDPHIWLQFPQIPSSIPTLDQRTQEINADQFDRLSFYLWLPENIGSGKRGRIVWHPGAETIEAFDAAYSESELFPVQPGWHLFPLFLFTQLPSLLCHGMFHY